MAVSETMKVVPTMSNEERQARLDALFARRDAALAAGLIEIWDIDRINKELGRESAETEE